MAQRYLRLSGADADWFERTRPAVPLVERYSVLLLAIETVDELADALDTVVIVSTESGSLLRIEPQKDGKILGASGGAKASFSFKLNGAAADGDERTLSELVWEQDATPLDEPIGDLTPEVADEPIENLNLDTRVNDNLRRCDVRTIGQLVAMTDGELLGIPKIGTGSIRDIDFKLRVRGLSRRNQHQR